jgi:hypothetical protein
VVEFQAGGVIGVSMCGWLKLEDGWWAGDFFYVYKKWDTCQAGDSEAQAF